MICDDLDTIIYHNPPLAEALAEQVVFEQQDISGDMIGFRLPQYLAGANVAGYHFHFLSTDRQVDGHVLDCEAGEVTVSFDAIEMVQMAVPQTAGFQNAATPDAADLSAAVTRLQSADLIYLAATPDDALPGVLALREAGHTVPILGGDGFAVTGLWADQPDVSQVFFTTHAYLGDDNDDPLVVAFREPYNQAYPDAVPDAFAALGYDAANLLIEAIRRAESSEPDAVRQALAGIRQFDGVTGKLGFLPGGQIPVKSVSILGVDAGSVQLIEQVMPEQVPAP